MHISLIRTNKILARIQIAAEIWAEIVKATAESEILSKITKASSTLASQLVASIYYKEMAGCLLLQIICLETLDSDE